MLTSKWSKELVKLRAYLRADRRDQDIRLLIDANCSLEADKIALVAENLQLLGQRETQADLIARSEAELSMVRKHLDVLERQAVRDRAEIEHLEKELRERGEVS